MRKHGWFRPHVRGLTAISSTTLREGGGWWLAGSQLDLDFANDRSYNRKTGYNATPNGLLTYTSPSPKMVYGADGVLGYAPHNLLTYSEDFSNAAWPKQNVTVTANAAVAPDGTTTADHLYPTTTGTSRRILRNLTPLTTAGVVYTQSLYVKSAGFRWFRTCGVNAASTADNIWFDIIDGVVGTVGGGVIAYSINSVGDGWFRVTVSGIADDFADHFWIACVDSDGSDTSTTSGTSGIYIWGAQLAEGSTALDYLATTSAARYSLPIDHDPLTGEALGVLIEEQRTNLLTYSQEFDNAAWAKGSSSATADQDTAPDGTLTADMLSVAAASGIYQSATVSASTTYTFSFWAKRGTRTEAQYRIYNNSAGSELVAATSYYSQINGSTYTRVTVTFTTPVGCTSIRCYVDLSGAAGTMYAWGAQLEAGAFATSYIQTGSAQVTRAADQVTLATSAFNFVDAPGTIVIEASTVFTAAAVRTIALFTDGASDYVRPYFYPNRGGLIIADGTAQCDLAPGSGLIDNTMYTQASAWATNDMASSLDGGTVATDTSGTMPSGMTLLRIGAVNTVGGYALSRPLKRLTYWNTRKPNAELQVLSA